jgi:hypothetical protein
MSIIRTLVRGFSKTFGDVPLIFRYTLLEFVNQLVSLVFKRRRFYMICSDLKQWLLSCFHDKVAILQFKVKASQNKDLNSKNSNLLLIN